MIIGGMNLSNRSINTQEIRPYKVEIFGLQDDYIGTLQSFDDTFLGQIIEPRLTIRDDGTQTFTCRVPKFYIDPKTNDRITNPRWQDAEADVLAENIRVLKVFIRADGKPENDKVYPMIIDTITDRRDSHFAVYKYIEASGLAFAELGKQGYKLELTSFTIEDENAKAAEKAEAEGKDLVFIEPTIQYWLDKVFPRDENGKWLTPWCYEIRMDYSHYAENRESNQVYEDAYVNGWDVVNETLVPTGAEKQRIKARYIDCQNSNKYNITQDIAQAFGVFCRYEYKTDLNGKFVREWTDKDGNTWTGKKVIFYNKAIKSENPYVIDYEKNLQTIERKSEGGNIYSKLYVKPIEASNMTNGYVTIADVAANPTYDEFILNFDYLKNVGAVKDWQLQKVKQYESAIRIINTKLAAKAPVLEKAQVELNEYEAKITLNDKEIQSTQENITRYETLRNGTEKDVIRSKTNPRRAAICKDGYDNYYIEFNSYDSVQLNTIAAYLNYPTESPKEYTVNGKTIKQSDANFETYKKPAYEINGIDEGELKSFTYGEEPTNKLSLTDDSFYAVLDDNGFLRKLYFNMSIARRDALVQDFGEPGEGDSITWQLYIVFAYHPANKYQARVDQYTKLLESLQGVNPDTTELGGTAKALKDAYDAKEAIYKSLLTEQQALLTEKEVLNQQLENVLGPALREGYWNPSEYKGVSEPHNEELRVEFDTEAKEGEEDLTYYYEGIGTDNETIKYRQYLKIDNYSILKDRDLSNLSIILTPKDGDKSKILTLFNNPNAGFEIIFSQVGDNGPISRIMVFNIEKTVLDRYETSAQYKFTYDNNTKEGNINLAIYNCDDSIHQVWPRIKIEKDNVQYNADTLVISKPVSGDEEVLPLERFYDYYYHIENGRPVYTFKISENQIFDGDLTDLKYNVSYETSAANEMLYLDARQVAKDNSIPRYSYSLTLSNLPHDFKHIDLSQLVYINDYSLGIHAATGYVNEITYHLDEPWEDEVNVQNYKTKFEDLFNTIVAQSEAMKNGQPAISNVVNNFGADGTIKGSVIQTALTNNDFYFNYSSTGIEITPTDGIILTNNKPYVNGIYGQVVLQGGGIFISNSIDDNGNRIWSTGITPDGINANLLTAGQINTDLIKIYAGDDIAFSWNKDGIYAYCDDGEGGYNPKSYVRFSKEGLHATQEGKDLVYLTWDGLYMRNKNGDRTFELDTDGNILMSGTLQSFNYEPGLLGRGWKIDQSGNAEFNDVSIRGTLSASVFKYDETTAVGGRIYVAPTIISTEGSRKNKNGENQSKLYFSNSSATRLIVEFPTPFVRETGTDKRSNNLAGREWEVNDAVQVNGSITDGTNTYQIKTRMFLSDSTFKDGVPDDNMLLGKNGVDTGVVNVFYDENGALSGQDVIVPILAGIRAGNYRCVGDWYLIYEGNGTGEPKREGIIITAMDEDGPFIDIFDDAGKVNRPIKQGPVVKLGKLDGLSKISGIRDYFGENNIPQGYGLYSDNVYLTGTIFANAGNFGGLKIEGNGITSTSNLTISSNSTLQVKSGSGISIESGGSFVLNSDNFKIDENGKVTVKGHVEAESGKIGSLTIEAVEDTSSTVDSITDKTGGKVIINKGAITADSLSAGLITTEHIESDFGKKLDISSNEGIGLYVAENGVSTSSVTLDKNGITMKSNGRIEIASGTSLNISSGGTFTIDSPKFKINSSGNVTIEGTITSTSGVIGGWNIGSSTIYSGDANAEVDPNYVCLFGGSGSNYSFYAGGRTGDVAKFWVKKDGSIKATSGTIGGWTIGTSSLYAGSGTSYVALSTSGDYRIWAGNQTASSAPFRVTTDGKVYMTRLMALSDENDTTPTEVNFSNNYWKLNRAVKTLSVSNNTLTIELYNGTSVNFKKALSPTALQ